MTPLPVICRTWDPLWLVEFRTLCDHCGHAIAPGDFRTLDDEILCSTCGTPAALRVLGEAEPCSHRAETAKAIVCRSLTLVGDSL